MKAIRLAIAGVGNCAGSLLQGLEYYRRHADQDTAGLMHPVIGGYRLEDIEVVAAFDIDRRKVGQPLERAVFAPPNCTAVFQPDLPRYGVTVQMGPILDGVAPHMTEYPPERTFQPADVAPCNVAEALRGVRADVLVCYLPVGSQNAVYHYAQAALDAGVAFVNCVPVFIASHPEWSRAFAERGLPVV
ncbi:MAG: inositol-3-phosphate synthase, partial [Planctomycetota bacterium]